MPVLESFTHLFPPPTYLTMPSAGLDISDTSLKYISLGARRRNGTRELKLWGDIDIPSNVLNRGEIKDQQQLANVLKEFKEKTKSSYVRVSLPEEKAYLFETEIKKGVSRKEVRSLLEFRLEENVPIPLRDALFDYQILPTKEESRAHKVAVAAYAKETVNKYFDACLEAGLVPTAFEVEAQAMARATVSSDEKNAVLVVDFGKTRTGVGIVHKGVLLYTSTIDLGGIHLSQALRKLKGDDVEESELTRIKNTEGLIRSIDNTRTYDALLSTVSVIKDELVTRMQYWHSQSDNIKTRPIRSIVLCGGSSNLNGLPEYLTETMGVTAGLADVWKNVLDTSVVVPPIDFRHSLGYATAIGLALQKSV
jgi:type IV pilus assembly protein PilM